MAATDLSQLPHAEQVDIYLETVFRGLSGYLEIRRITADGVLKREMFSDIRAVKKFLTNGNTDGWNVYVGQATRISNFTAKGAGAKDQLHSARVFWADLDFKKKGDPKRLITALKTFPMKPSMVVNSGNGVHLYWVLDEPYDLNTEDKRTRFECILKGICDALGGDRAVTDSSRIMRVPGTTNYPNAKKRADGRVEVPAVLLEYHQ